MVHAVVMVTHRDCDNCCDNDSRNISGDILSGYRTNIGGMAMAANAMIKAVADLK